MEIVRQVLIVDDSDDIEQDVKQYISIFNKIKNEKGLSYNLNITNVQTYDDAIGILVSDQYVFDVLLIDYDLSTKGSSLYGDDLIKEVRMGINKNCKIIFYTMHELSEVFQTREELIQLFNTGIYRFITKDLGTESERVYGSPEHQLRVEEIVNAIEDIDIIQVTLERYFAEFGELTDDERVVVDSQEYSIGEIIRLIRKDDEAGRKYKKNLAESVIIQNLSRGSF
ncbi:TPA: hypothetical protein VGS93_003745 [Bacillus cereus]|nr:hypothetical protein [Bacillus cereus]